MAVSDALLQQTELGVGFGEIGLEPDSSTKFFDGLSCRLVVRLVARDAVFQHTSEIVVGLRALRSELYCFLQQAESLGVLFLPPADDSEM